MEVTTDLVPPAAPVEKSRQTSASACELYRETIQLGLSQGRNAMGIWQDLVDSYGFRGGYQSVKRFVRKLRGMQSPEARVVIETPPGEELQVDYGSGPMVRDPQSGKYRRTRMFVLTLGYSRKSVRLLCFRSSTRTWAELHEQAFRRLGGSTRIVVLDNLREGVLVPEEALREAMCSYLRSLGYTVLGASSGKQALSVTGEHEGHIDLLITDLVMPGMSGRELSQMLGSLRPDLKTICMSGYADDVVLRHGIHKLGAAFLQKPFGLETLARKVRETLGQTGLVQ